MTPAIVVIKKPRRLTLMNRSYPVTPVTFPIDRPFSNTEDAGKGAYDVEKSLHEQAQAPQSLGETQRHSAHRRKHGQGQGTRTEGSKRIKLFPSHAPNVPVGSSVFNARRPWTSDKDTQSVAVAFDKLTPEQSVCLCGDDSESEVCRLSISARFRASSSLLWKIRPRNASGSLPCIVHRQDIAVRVLE